MRRRTFCAGVLGGILLPSQRSIFAARSLFTPGDYMPPSVDLSGEWEFQIDPLDIGVAEKWFEKTVPLKQKIQVPGAWNAQGFAFESKEQLHAYEDQRSKELSAMKDVVMTGGPESDRLFHVYPGPGWYRKKITIPAEWKGKIPWLVFAGVHRKAEVWINGQYAGTHQSYLTPLRIDLSSYVEAGEAITMVARVDGRREMKVDPLLGCLDTLDFLYITWGGIYRKVTLEAKDSTQIEDVFIVPHLDTETAEIWIGIQGSRKAGPLAVAVEILDSEGISVASARQVLTDKETGTALMPRIAKARHWSPKTPYLYTVRVQLLSKGKAIDVRSIRFGMREFKVEGKNFFLNGKPIFLRGYGDDCIFPNTICPPVDKAELYHRLSTAREYGFNYVRHHSWIPPAEYCDVADELGMMLQPEFPFVGPPNFSGAPEARRSALEQWGAVIRSHRNHPSIVTWCMGNEIYNPFDMAPEMYEIAKRLDPSRPVIDTDGCNFNAKNRKTLDFMTVQFNEGDSMGYEDKKYDIPANIGKPVVAHEMGYFCTLPDLAQLKLFKDGLRPYWLLKARDLAQQGNVLDAYPEWLAASYRLQAVCLKTNIEAARRSHLNGTSVWLFQDYPNCAEGVMDMFLRPKAFRPEEFRKFNSPTVLLMDVPRRNWWSGETAEISFLVSRFEDVPSNAAKLHWALKNGNVTLTEGIQEKLQIRSDGVQELHSIQLKIPDSPQANHFTLTVKLIDANGRAENFWDLWSFPKKFLMGAKAKVRTSGLETFSAQYPWAQEHPGGPVPIETQLFVTAKLDHDIRDYLKSGGRVLLMDPDPVFSVEKTNFRLSSWDGGGPSGTIIDAKHAALRAMPSEGWCDLQFYSLIQGSKTILLDPIPTKIEPLVRCIDRPTRLDNRAYLFEALIGSGKLLVSGFNFSQAIGSKDPAGIFLLDQLVRYALGPDFEPKASISEADLKINAGK